MTDWQTVRLDSIHEEPLDPEIIPLCDALNAAGFVTVASCWGHGGQWPCVVFEHSSDDRIESLARFIFTEEEGDFRPYHSRLRKEFQLNGYLWMIEAHLDDVYEDTPIAEVEEKARSALANMTYLINLWSSLNP